MSGLQTRKAASRRLWRPTKYLLVGFSLFLVDLSIVVGLVKWAHMHPAVAQLIGRASGAALGFQLHRSITFREHGDSMRFGIAKQGAGYTIVTVVMFALSPVILMAALQVTAGRLVAAKVLAEVVLVTMTYIGLKHVFQGRGADGQP